MSLIKVVPYVLGVTPGVLGAPEPRMYPRSGYFLVMSKILPLAKKIIKEKGVAKLIVYCFPLGFDR